MLFISSDLPWLYPYQARIRLHLPVHAAAERLPPTAGHLQADGENACILHTGAESPDVLAIYVAILGTDFEILDPPELAEHILALAGQAYPCSTPLQPAPLHHSTARARATGPAQWVSPRGLRGETHWWQSEDCHQMRDPYECVAHPGQHEAPGNVGAIS